MSVSNPKSKYVVYLSVLSQISNCQGLGRKNKHEILKTDHNNTNVNNNSNNDNANRDDDDDANDNEHEILKTDRRDL